MENLESLDPLLPDLSALQRCSNAVTSLTSRPFFETYVLTLGFGLVLYLADIFSDVYNGVHFILQGDKWWGLQTLGMILLPGLLRGIYELLRRPIVYELVGQSKRLKADKSCTLPTLFYFGLDVIPGFKIEAPGWCSIFIAPFYILIMAFWFPFLPLIQYLKLFVMQMSLARQTSDVSDETYQMIFDESRRAIKFKSVESFLESAPQLYLQIYIIYKRMSFEEVMPSLVSIFFSAVSLLKTTYDLAEVDRLEKAVSSPKNVPIYFFTSLFWFFSTITFRSLSISLLSLYLSQYYELIGIAFVPAIIFAAINVALRQCFKVIDVMLNGIMATVAPIKFITIRKQKSTEMLTRNYLVSYVTLNTVIHVIGLAIVCGINHQTDFSSEILAQRWWIQKLELPIIGILCVLSILSAILHWKVSLRDLFRSDVKYPSYKDQSARLKTFSPHWKEKVRISFTAKEASEGGFFCNNPSIGWPITCFDCGLTIREKNTYDNVHILHAASLFKYKITYDKFDDKKKLNPELMREAFSKAIRVKPKCGILSKKKISFEHYPIRLQSHFYSNHIPTSSWSPEELSKCGFVGTSPMTVACFQCRSTINLSDVSTQMRSPWELHAWSKPGFECQHLMTELKCNEIRLKTYPREWFQNENPKVPKPNDLALAGFFCGYYGQRDGRAWVKCYACKAFSFQWPSLKTTNLEILANKLGRIELPGKAYGYLQNDQRREVPLISHYIQNINCSFIQTTLMDSNARYQTFPPDWNETMKVSAGELAQAGFIFYPVDNQTVKFAPHTVAKKNISKTICPKCLLVIDWSKPDQTHPKDVDHCRKDYIKDINQLSKLKGRVEEPD